jgi:hypothetical protein
LVVPIAKWKMAARRLPAGQISRNVSQIVIMLEGYGRQKRLSTRPLRWAIASSHVADWPVATDIAAQANVGFWVNSGSACTALKLT